MNELREITDNKCSISKFLSVYIYMYVCINREQLKTLTVKSHIMLNDSSLEEHVDMVVVPKPLPRTHI